MSRGVKILIWLFVLPILLFVCALVMIWLPLPKPFPPALSKGRNLLAAVLTGILGMAFVFGLFFYVVSSFLQVGRVFEQTFVSRGLDGQSYLFFGRLYRGVVQGSRVEARFMPARAIKPSLLEIEVSARLAGRVAIGRQKPLLDCARCPRIEVEAPELQHLYILAEQEPWARALLADPAAIALVGRLTSASQELYLQPDRVWLRVHLDSAVDPALGGEWLDDLLQLAAAAVKVSPLPE